MTKMTNKVKMSKSAKLTISELKMYYPIPNIFAGLNVKESKKHLQSLIKGIEKQQIKMNSK
jgi:hypothetical protein